MEAPTRTCQATDIHITIFTGPIVTHEASCRHCGWHRYSSAADTDAHLIRGEIEKFCNEHLASQN